MTSASQGWPSRSARARSNKAVQKTTGEILTYHGDVAKTYYSSSSGGRTEAVGDAWPGATALPYLRSVADPYDTYSPNHDWGPFAYSASRLGALLGLGGSIESLTVKRDSSSRVSDVRIRLTSGKAAVVDGEAVTRALGLKSTWFSIGRPRHDGPRGSVEERDRVDEHAPPNENLPEIVRMARIAPEPTRDEAPAVRVLTPEGRLLRVRDSLEPLSLETRRRQRYCEPSRLDRAKEAAELR